MIIYYSATGNSKYVAERIAEKTNEKMISMIEAYKKKNYEFSIEKEESLGIIAPTYFLGLPNIVNEFLSKINIKSSKKPYIYSISTYGTFSGQAGHYINQHVKKAGYPLMGRFSVKMVDTWTVRFDLSNKEKNQKQNELADIEIDEIINKIQKKEEGDYIKNKLPKIISNLFYKKYDSSRKTKHLHVENTCSGCGLCAKYCPKEAIEIENKRPVWIKDKCEICLRCLHRCPQFSIQYDNKTQNHGQYTNKKVKLND